MAASSSSSSRLVLVANAGSSSLKFKLFEATGSASSSLRALAGGLLDRIGDAANSTMTTTAVVSGGNRGGASSSSSSKSTSAVPIRDHVDGMKRVLDFLGERFPGLADHHGGSSGSGSGGTASGGVTGSSGRLVAVGHRVVHGLDLTQACLVTPAVKAKIREAAKLAPLHNPAGLAGIEAAEAVFGASGGNRGGSASVQQAAVFDTAYHAASLPQREHVYPLPWELYDTSRPQVRKYGFHGTSHKFLSLEAARMLRGDADPAAAPADDGASSPPSLPKNLITCHLGNGSSAAAILRGRSVATSMGLTPLEGLMMGTRCGDLDPAVPLYLMEALGKNGRELDALLNKKSGLLGVCGRSDVRAVLEGASQGDARCSLALDMYCYRVRKYVGAYMAVLDGDVDAIVFSAGIGENSPVVRAGVLGGLERLGVAIDAEKNARAVGGAVIGRGVDISAPDSRVKVLVIPTDEELMIAREALEVVERGGGDGGGGRRAN
jgi:acetate kinase